MRLSPVAVALIAAMSAFPSAAAVLNAEKQTFDSAAEASAQGWAALNYPFTTPPDSLGWSGTNSTAGVSASGEGGGAMLLGGVSYYADLSLGKVGATLGLNHRIESSGEFAFPTQGSAYSSATFIGHFTSANTGNNRGTLAFTINEEGVSGKFRVLARSFLSGGTFAWAGGSESASGPAAGTTWLTLDVGTPYAFTSVWDPTIGNGQHRIEFFDNTNPLSPVSMGVILANMSSAIRSSAEFTSTSLDAFGLRKGFQTVVVNPNNSWTMFIDDVAYTTIPEPGVAAIASALGALLFTSRPRTRRRVSGPQGISPEKGEGT